MTIDLLIDRLTHLRKQHGNLPITVDCDAWKNATLSEVKTIQLVDYNYRASNRIKEKQQTVYLAPH